MYTSENPTPDPTLYNDEQAHAAATEAEVTDAGVNSDNDAISPPDVSFTSEQAEAMVNEAYIRGRNEAIARSVAEASPTHAVNRTPGNTDPATPPSDPELAAIFSLRHSVWE